MSPLEKQNSKQQRWSAGHFKGTQYGYTLKTTYNICIRFRIFPHWPWNEATYDEFWILHL